MYRVVYGEACPRVVAAEIPSYPHHDSEGTQIFENTHFLNLEDAWQKHMAEHKAGVILAARTVERLRAELRKAESSAADAAIAFRAAEWEFERRVK